MVEGPVDNIYSVVLCPAQYDGKYYPTLADAVAAVVASDSKTGTVTLLKDSQGGGIGLFNSKGAVGVDLTIDLGGYTYTCTCLLYTSSAFSLVIKLWLSGRGKKHKAAPAEAAAAPAPAPDTPADAPDGAQDAKGGEAK